MAGAGDNGGWTPDGGSPDDLPELPAEWGVIVIPDDLTELDDEVRAIRSELRLAETPSRWQRLLRRPGTHRLRRAVSASLRAPVLIITLAVLVTVASLFAAAWPGPPRQPAAQRTSGTTTGERSTTLPALDLVGTDGRHVSLRGQLPAVILLIDGCACPDLVAATISEVRPDIAVVTIAGPGAATSAPGTPPTGAAPQAQGKAVRTLHDPAGNTRNQLNLPAAESDTATALLVSRDGEIIRTVPRIASIDDISADLARL
ncbi:MAG TPA: hypothetical protein VGB74_16675 [Actinoplanes sp.]|jgi:hypothetical protein